MTQLTLAGFESRATGAVFSECRRYRFALMRRWADGDWYGEVEGGILNMCMLNPSAADEHVNDPTVERCERRARLLGFGALVVTNIFAWRETDSRLLRKVSDPVGTCNDHSIVAWAMRAKMVICAWGRMGELCHRSERVLNLFKENKIDAFALRTCANGSPEHPLYIPYSTQPKPFVTNSV